MTDVSWPRLNLTPAERRDELDFYSRHGFPTGEQPAMNYQHHSHHRNQYSRSREVRATLHSVFGYLVSAGLALLPWMDELLKHKNDVPTWLASSITALAIVAGGLHHYSGEKFPR